MDLAALSSDERQNVSCVAVSVETNGFVVELAGTHAGAKSAVGN
jgi:hypothetical protein